MNESLMTEEVMKQLTNDLFMDFDVDNLDCVKALATLNHLNDTVFHSDDPVVINQLQQMTDLINGQNMCNCKNAEDIKGQEENIDFIHPWPLNRQVLPEFLHPNLQILFGYLFV